MDVKYYAGYGAPNFMLGYKVLLGYQVWLSPKGRLSCKVRLSRKVRLCCRRLAYSPGFAKNESVG